LDAINIDLKAFTDQFYKEVCGAHLKPVLETIRLMKALGVSVGELINIVALAIQKEVTVSELDMMQIATHPLLTSSPTVYPLINAAQQALAKLRAGAK